MKCHLTGPSLNTLCPALTTPTSSSSSSSSSSNQLRWRQVPPEQSLGLTRFELKTSDVRGCSQCSVSPLPGTCDECLLCRFYTWFPVWCDLDERSQHIPSLPSTALLAHLWVSGDRRDKVWAACRLSPGTRGPPVLPHLHHHQGPPPQSPDLWWLPPRPRCSPQSTCLPQSQVRSHSSAQSSSCLRETEVWDSGVDFLSHD